MSQDMVEDGLPTPEQFKAEKAAQMEAQGAAQIEAEGAAETEVLTPHSTRNVREPKLTVVYSPPTRSASSTTSQLKRWVDGAFEK